VDIVHLARRFDTIPACDGRTYGRTDTRRRASKNRNITIKQQSCHF